MSMGTAVVTLGAGAIANGISSVADVANATTLGARIAEVAIHAGVHAAAMGTWSGVCAEWQGGKFREGFKTGATMGAVTGGIGTTIGYTGADKWTGALIGGGVGAGIGYAIDKKDGALTYGIQGAVSGFSAGYNNETKVDTPEADIEVQQPDSPGGINSQPGAGNTTDIVSQPSNTTGPSGDTGGKPPTSTKSDGFWDSDIGKFIQDAVVQGMIGYASAQVSRLAALMVAYEYQDKMRDAQIESYLNDGSEEELQDELDELYEEMILYTSIVSGVSAGLMNTWGSIMLENVDTAREIDKQSELVKKPLSGDAPKNNGSVGRSLPTDALTNNGSPLNTDLGGGLARLGEGALIGLLSGTSAGLAYLSVDFEEDPRKAQLLAQVVGTAGTALGQTVVEYGRELFDKPTTILNSNASTSFEGDEVIIKDGNKEVARMSQEEWEKKGFENNEYLAIRGSKVIGVESFEEANGRIGFYASDDIERKKQFASLSSEKFEALSRTPETVIEPEFTFKDGKVIITDKNTGEVVKTISEYEYRDKGYAGAEYLVGENLVKAEASFKNNEVVFYAVEEDPYSSPEYIQRQKMGLVDNDSSGTATPTTPVALDSGSPEYIYSQRMGLDPDGPKAGPEAEPSKPPEQLTSMSINEYRTDVRHQSLPEQMVTVSWNDDWDNGEGRRKGRWEAEFRDYDNPDGAPTKIMDYGDFKDEYHLKGFSDNFSWSGRDLAGVAVSKDQKRGFFDIVGGMAGNYAQRMMSPSNLAALTNRAVEYIVYKEIDKKSNDLDEGQIEIISYTAGDLMGVLVDDTLKMNAVTAADKSWIYMNPVEKLRLENELVLQAHQMGVDKVEEEIYEDMMGKQDPLDKQLSQKEIKVVMDGVASQSQEREKQVSELLGKSVTELSSAERKELKEILQPVLRAQAAESLHAKLGACRDDKDRKIEKSAFLEALAALNYDNEGGHKISVSSSEIWADDVLNDSRSVFAKTTLPKLAMYEIDRYLQKNHDLTPAQRAHTAGVYVAPVIHGLLLSQPKDTSSRIIKLKASQPDEDGNVSFYDADSLEQTKLATVSGESLKGLQDGESIRQSDSGATIISPVFFKDDKTGEVIITDIGNLGKEYARISQEEYEENGLRDAEYLAVAGKKWTQESLTRDIGPVENAVALMGAAELQAVSQIMRLGYPGKNPSAYSFAGYVNNLPAITTQGLLSEDWRESQYVTNLYTNLGESHIGGAIATNRGLAKLFNVNHEYAAKTGSHPSITLKGASERVEDDPVKFLGQLREAISPIQGSTDDEGRIQSITLSELPSTLTNEELDIWINQLNPVQTAELEKHGLIKYDIDSKVESALTAYLGEEVSEMSQEEVLGMLMTKLETEDETSYKQLLGGDTELKIDGVTVAESDSRGYYIYFESPYDAPITRVDSGLTQQGLPVGQAVTFEPQSISRQRTFLFNYPGPLPLRRKDLWWRERVADSILRDLTSERAR
ncbi:MAG: hypothetical protein JRI96_15515 [Deltaproteobacteria bacterium]|nr:hypothetical protein [Deltaproteobacteria bacterium]